MSLPSKGSTGAIRLRHRSGTARFGLVGTSLRWDTPLASLGVTISEADYWFFGECGQLAYDKPRSAQRCIVTFWGSHFRPLNRPFVEVKGLEPSASALRKYGSQCFDQVLFEDLPGSSVAVPSGPLTIPPLPSR